MKITSECILWTFLMIILLVMRVFDLLRCKSVLWWSICIVWHFDDIELALESIFGHYTVGKEIFACVLAQSRNQVEKFSNLKGFPFVWRWYWIHCFVWKCSTHTRVQKLVSNWIPITHILFLIHTEMLTNILMIFRKSCFRLESIMNS